MDAVTQQSVGFLLLVTALPFLGPAPVFHLQPSTGLFVGSLVLTYFAIGVIGPTQSVLSLRILLEGGLSQQDVAGALSAANVTFSMLGSLCGPLLSGCLVPYVLDFEHFTTVQAICTGLGYLLPLFLLQVPPPALLAALPRAALLPWPCRDPSAGSPCLSLSRPTPPHLARTQVLFSSSALSMP